MDRHLGSLLRTFGLAGLTLSASASFAYPTPVDFVGSLLRWPVNRDSPPVTYEIVAENPEDESVVGRYG